MVVIVHPLSDVEKPNPATETVIPGGPVPGVSVMVGTEVTVKVADVASAAMTSGFAVIVYANGAGLVDPAILSWPFKFPPEIVHEASDIVRPGGAEENKHAVLLGLNPFPETVTVVPTGPDVGVSTILDLRMKFAVAVSAAWTPVTVTTYVTPATADDATVKWPLIEPPPIEQV